MKIIHLVPLFLLMSCTSMDIKTLDINTIQGLRGKVKEMDISSSRYQINETGTSEIYSLKTHSTIFFNKKNKILKQIDKYQNLTTISDFIYNDNLLIKRIDTVNNRIDKTEYKYNKKKNLIGYDDFENGNLSFSITYTYDPNKNPIQILRTFYTPEPQISKETLKYNYEERTAKIYIHDRMSDPNSYLKMYYNKRGLKIKLESIQANNNSGTSTTYEYDKWGNLLKQVDFDEKLNPSQILTYKYIYDRKGNTTQIEEYSKYKMTSKTVIKITYW